MKKARGIRFLGLLLKSRYLGILKVALPCGDGARAQVPYVLNIPVNIQT